MSVTSAISSGIRFRVVARALLIAFFFMLDARAESQVTAPVIEKVTLESGLRAVVRHEPAARTLAICVFVGAGVAEEGNQPGIASLVSRALFGSNANQSREEVLHSIYDVGGSLETEWNPDYTLYTCVTSPDRFEDALYVIAQALKGSQFDAESVSAAKSDVLTAISRSEQDSYDSAYASLRQRMYRESPYRESFGGTTSSIRKITAEHMRAFYRRWYTPENTVFSITGSVGVGRARRALENYLDDYVRKGAPRRKSSAPELLSESGHITRFQPTHTATLVAGFAGPGLLSPDFPAWHILSAVIGGGKSSRVWKAVRESAGIGYVARAQAVPLARESPMVVHLEYDPKRNGIGKASLVPELAGEVLLKTAKSVLVDPPAEREIDRAKTFAIGSYALSHQRVRDRAYYLGWYELLGLGFEFDARFPSMIASVTQDQVKAAAETYLQRQIQVTLLPGVK